MPARKRPIKTEPTPPEQDVRDLQDPEQTERDFLRDAAARPAKKPDADKLARQLLDAITGVIYADDGQVVSLLCEKHYAEGDQPPRTEVEVSVLLQQTVGVVMPDEQMALAA
jgi:Holliday junction resolvase RusA-like endonuclease